MKVCIFGAGAIGSNLAARIGSVPGVELSIIARGAHLLAVQESGITLQSDGRELHAFPLVATERAEDLPPQDIVFVTLKAASQAVVARQLDRLIAKGGHAVFVCNGIPWWWRYGTDAPGPLPLVDTDCSLWNDFGAERALGCVVYSGNEVIAPGVVRHFGNDTWYIGEPDYSRSERAASTVELMTAGGIGAVLSLEIRADIFRKLMKNAAYNSVCALTRLPLEWLADDPSVISLAYSVVDEINLIAEAMGFDTHQARLDAKDLRGRPPGLPLAQGQKPSMLQDVLAGRPTEVEALLGQVTALAEELSVPCTTTKILLSLMRGLDLQLRLH